MDNETSDKPIDLSGVYVWKDFPASWGIFTPPSDKDRSDEVQTDWTIERVKEDLPEIQVMFKTSSGQDVSVGQVTGRELDCAVVYYRDGHRTTARVEAAWSTLVRLLNDGVPLIGN